jgi:DNA repair exonuclease SbcCD ATPase subunit
LGSELKSQWMHEQHYQQHIQQHQHSLEGSLKNLRRLRKALKDKITFITSSLLQDRCHHYMQQIDVKITEIIALQKALEKREIELKEILKIYEKQLKKIPRYHELQEETYLGMLGSKAASAA